jgi:hypothetical protein
VEERPVNERQARRARSIALRTLAYRAWSNDPGLAPIPAMVILSDPALHAREASRRLRRAQNGIFDTPPSARPVAV